MNLRARVSSNRPPHCLLLPCPFSVFSLAETRPRLQAPSHHRKPLAHTFWLKQLFLLEMQIPTFPFKLRQLGFFLPCDLESCLEEQLSVWGCGPLRAGML